LGIFSRTLTDKPSYAILGFFQSSFNAKTFTIPTINPLSEASK
jgi:hypothetical protein